MSIERLVIAELVTVLDQELAAEGRERVDRRLTKLASELRVAILSREWERTS